MTIHYTYQAKDDELLFQGDILKRTDALLDLLKETHQYYYTKSDYKYFMVMTQTCDLHKRKNSLPKAPYITICAVRPLSVALEKEAESHQIPWQKEHSVISDKAKNKLILFLERLLNNNNSKYFYIHKEPSYGISDNMCAFLNLPISLLVEHYDLCLAAKIAQLTDVFQAKLGSPLFL